METEELIARIKHIESHFNAKFELDQCNEESFMIGSEFVTVQAHKTCKGWVYTINFKCTLFNVSHIPDGIAQMEARLKSAITPNSAPTAEENQ
jgi:hypothetical protein